MIRNLPRTLLAAAALQVFIPALAQAQSTGEAREITLADGATVRGGRSARFAVNADGSLRLTGGTVLISGGDTPHVIIVGEQLTTVTGGLFFATAENARGVRLISLAGDATVAIAGGDTFELPAGHFVGIAPGETAGTPGQRTPIVPVDLAAIARSSAILKSATLPAAARDALAGALATQASGLRSGDLAPTQVLVLNGASRRGLALASASEVQTALNAAGTGQTLALSDATGTGQTLALSDATGTLPAVVTPVLPTNSSLFGYNLATTGDKTYSQNYNLSLAGDTVSIAPGAKITLNATTPTYYVNQGSYYAPELALVSVESLALSQVSLTAPWISVSSLKDITVTGGTYKADGISFDAPGAIKISGAKFITLDGNLLLGSVSSLLEISNTVITFISNAPAATMAAKTINLKDVDLPSSIQLSSTNGILNIGSSMDGAVNFISGVTTAEKSTDLMTKGGLNSAVKLKDAGSLRYQGGSIAGTVLDGTSGSTSGGIQITAINTSENPTGDYAPTYSKTTSGPTIQGTSLAFDKSVTIPAATWDAMKPQFIGDAVTFASGITLGTDVRASEDFSVFSYTGMNATGVTFKFNYVALVGRGDVSFTGCTFTPPLPSPIAGAAGNVTNLYADRGKNEAVSGESLKLWWRMVA